MCKHPGCGMILSTRQVAQEHYLVNHTPPEEGLIACPSADCSFSHKLQRKVNEHVKRVHENHRPHTCSQCDKAFKTTEKLRVHTEGVHEGKKRFACTQCSFETYHKQVYQKHMSNGHAPLQAARGEQHANTVIVDGQRARNQTQLNVVNKFATAFPDLHDEYRIDCLAGAIKPYVRVDAALFRSPTVVVLLDVDEKQHRDTSKYSVASECERMQDAHAAICHTFQRAVMWIRFNPDTYTVNKFRVDTSLDERVSVAIQAAQTFIASATPDAFNIAYVGFDVVDGQAEMTTHPDYAESLAAHVRVLKCPGDVEGEAKAAQVHRNKRAANFDKPVVSSDYATVEVDSKRACVDHLACPTCDRTFSDSSHLHRHIREVHDNQKRLSTRNFPCTYQGCTAVYTEPHNLKRHVEADHMGVRHTCDVCGATSSSKSNLYTHKKNMHGVGFKKLFKCTFPGCNYTTPYGNSLMKKHFERNHSGGGASAEAQSDSGAA